MHTPVSAHTGHNYFFALCKKRHHFSACRNEVFMNSFTETLANVLQRIDDVVWGPVMLLLLVGTGIFLTIKTKALCWRNLPYAIKSVLSKEARQKKGDGDVSPFSALTTALAATIGTGNIVGVATAMVSGGPGALVWMWLSAAFGITSKFSECMLAIKYREVNEKGEMSGGPMLLLCYPVIRIIRVENALSRQGNSLPTCSLLLMLTLKKFFIKLFFHICFCKTLNYII